VISVRGDYDVVRYRPDLRQEMLELQRYSRGPDTAFIDSCLRWRYEENPFADDVTIYLAIHRRRVVGMRGFMASAWRRGVAGGTARFHCGGDLVIAPAHQGRGVFNRIMAFALEDLSTRGESLALSFSASPVTFLRSQRMGWRLVGAYRPQIWQRRSKALARRLRSATKGRTFVWRFHDRLVPLLERGSVRAFERIAESVDRDGSAQTPLSFRLEPDIERMLDLHRRVTPDDRRIRLAMSDGYLAWRYANPERRYGFLYAGNASLAGYIVVGADRRGDLHDLSIVDWQCERLEDFRRMLGALQRCASVESLSIWSATLGEPVVSVLKSQGFAPFDDTRGKPYYTPGLLICETGASSHLGPPGTDPARMSVMADWDLRMIASDHY